MCLLVHIREKEKIAPEIARVNGPLDTDHNLAYYCMSQIIL